MYSKTLLYFLKALSGSPSVVIARHRCSFLVFPTGHGRTGHSPGKFNEDTRMLKPGDVKRTCGVTTRDIDDTFSLPTEYVHMRMCIYLHALLPNRSRICAHTVHTCRDAYIHAFDRLYACVICMRAQSHTYAHSRDPGDEFAAVFPRHAAICPCLVLCP